MSNALNLEKTLIAQVVEKTIKKAKKIAVIQIKGGSMKTTTVQIIGTSLAAQGHKVLIIDFDEQKTGIKWSDRRDVSLDAITDNAKSNNGLKKLNRMKSVDVIALEADGFDWNVISQIESEYDYILFDTHGHMSNLELARNAVKISDMVIVPFKNTTKDLEQRFVLEEVINQFKKEFKVTEHIYSLVYDFDKVQHEANTSAILMEDVKDTLPVIPVPIFARRSWLAADELGLSALEYGNDTIARGQIKRLGLFINRTMNGGV